MDNLGQAVSGTSVSVNISGPTSLTDSGTTGTNGVVTFAIDNPGSGSYVTAVTAVTGAGLTWDGDSPPSSYTLK